MCLSKSTDSVGHVMLNILAVVIDDSIVHLATWVCVVVIPTIGGSIWCVWRKFIAWLSTKAELAWEKGIATVDEHNAMVSEMKAQVPVVTETLKSLGETQKLQCKTLENHGQKLSDHHIYLQEMKETLKRIEDRKCGE